MTQKRTRFRLKAIQTLIDLFVVLVCVTVCILSLYYFWFDLNTSTSRTDKDEIATVTFKYKIAQRKFADRVVWERLQQRSPLYNEDTIRTADMAEATIYFKDGTEVALKENSMLQIFYSDDNLSVSVSGGNIEVDTSNAAKNVSVKMADSSVVDLSSGSKLVAKSSADNSTSNFQLQSGNGKITTKDGMEETIEKGDSVKLNSAGKFIKSPITVTSISDDVRILNFGEEPAIIHLEWNRKEETEESPVYIETSKTKDFSKIIESFKVENQDSFDVPADDGTVYWRVYTKETASEPATGKVRVQNIEQTALMSPTNGTKFSYRNIFPQIYFSWTGHNDAEHYRLEISRTEDFFEPLLSKNYSMENAKISSLGQGFYYWRVTPFFRVNNLGYGEPSETGCFEILRKAELQPPALLLPGENSTIFYKQTDFNINFRWKTDSEENDFKLEIARDAGFEDIVYTENTVECSLSPKLTINQLPAGQYYWKITNHTPEAVGTLESEVRSFYVKEYIPSQTRLINPSDNLIIEENKTQTINFMWKVAAAYENNSVTVFQISRTENFDDILLEKKELNNQISKIKLEKGNYFWRIGNFDSVEDKLVYSDAYSLTVVPELVAPVIYSPLENETFVMLQNQNVKFTWSEVEGADYYSVRMFDPETRKIFVKNDEVRGTEVSLPVNFVLTPEKKTVATVVQAFGDKNDVSDIRKGKQAVKTFYIRSPQAVQQVSPGDKSVINGLMALKRPVVLEWKEESDKSEKSQLVLKKLQKDGQYKTIETVENPKFVHSFEKLTEGTYQWTVKASTEQGFVIDTPQAYTFTITPVEELSKPILMIPSHKSSIEKDYLAKNRIISFEWKPVLNATDYTFVLYQKNKDGTLKRIYIEELLKTTTVKFRHLDKLDNGVFEWHVTAYAHAKDGYEEQHSKTVSGEFNINIGLPKSVKIKKLGKLYGE